MTDLGHELLLGVAMPPSARDHEAVLETTALAEELGLDIAGFQDHPYQPGFLDTWTLLSYLAARTSRIRLFPDVANVAMRPPAVLAHSAAALDILSGGRLELGLGAGYFLDQIAAMGGPRRSMTEHVEALGEAITVMRRLWTPGPPVHLEGRYHRLDGARPGPSPAHPLRIWLGAYRRRMLRLTGRSADGWVPSLGYADPADLPRMAAAIDAAAEEEGRDPADIRRGFNVSGTFAPNGAGFLQGPPAVWAEQLAELALEQGFSAFLLGIGPDGVDDLRRFAGEVAPAVRELVAAERRRAAGEPAPRPARVRAAEPQPAAAGAIGQAGQQTLLAIHEHLRQELARLRGVLVEVAAGRATAAEARSYLHRMTMRQNYWTVGAFCAAYCRVVSVHHAIEDEHMFADLRAADQSLGPILARLREEHEGIADLLADVDAALVGMVEDDERLDDARRAVDRLGEELIAHLRREEDQLLEPIGRLGIRI